MRRGGWQRGARRWRGVVAVLVALGLGGCTAQVPAPSPTASGYAFGPGQLAIGALTSWSSTAATRPLREYLDAVTSKSVQVVQGDDGATLLQLLYAGQVDVAVVPTSSYVAASDAGMSLDVLATVIPPGAAEASYASVGVVPSASAVQSISDLHGSRVCFSGQSSTAGYLYPRAALLAAGIDPDDGITPVVADDSSQVEQFLSSGKCDAGFLAVWGGMPADSGLREFSRSEVPAPVVVASAALPPSVRSTVAKALVGLSPVALTARKVASTSQFRQSFAGFAPVAPGFFDPTVSACAATASSLCRFTPAK